MMHCVHVLDIIIKGKVHTVYMFLACFEACQVSELATDL